jgi:VanZ family protein
MKKLWYWLLPLIWMGVIFYSSGQPYEEQDIKPFLSRTIDFSFLEPVLQHIQFTYHHSEVSIQALGINGVVEFLIRKGAHFTVFFLLCMFFIIAFVKSSSLRRSVIVGLSLVLTVLYAIADEVHQGFTPNRTPYFGDVVIDTIGALFGVIFYLIYLKLSKS